MLKFKSISTKIALGYLIITVLTALLLGGSFYALLRVRLVNEARLNLKERGELVVERFSRLPVERWRPEEYFARPQERQQQRRGEIDYVLINQDRMVVDSSMKERFPTGKPLEKNFFDLRLAKKIQQGQAVSVSNKEFVLVGIPINGDEGPRGMLLLLTSLSVLNAVSKALFLILVRVLAVSAAASILLGLLLARRVTRPMRLVQERAHQIARRDFKGELILNTGDELEDLAVSINRMTCDLETHDLAQKKFLQNASHELKTPLMSIQGYAEGIKDGVLEGEDADRGMEIIIKESKRLKESVDEILYLSRLESFQETYSLQMTNVREVLVEALDTVRAVAAEKEVSLEMECFEGANLSADREKLFRVFLNILSNGIRYASKVLRVKCERELSPVELKLVFQDDGAGFSQQDLKHLFDRFYKGTKGNTGLGMAIARTIVEGHGGRISAANAPEGGAVIMIILPLSGEPEHERPVRNK